MTELTTDKIIQYLEQRIKFLREIREDNERKLLNQSDPLRHIWKNDEITIQAKLVEAEMTLHVIKYPDQPFPNVLGK